MSVLYLECEDFESRQKMVEELEYRFDWIDCTGGQAAFEDDDLQEFGDLATSFAKELNVKLRYILRMPDPGLGLCITDEWIEAGLASREIQSYHNE